MVTSIDGREGFWDWQDRVMASLGFNHTIESLLNSMGRGTWKVGMVGGGGDKRSRTNSGEGAGNWGLALGHSRHFLCPSR